MLVREFIEELQKEAEKQGALDDELVSLGVGNGGDFAKFVHWYTVLSRTNDCDRKTAKEHRMNIYY